MKYGGFRGRRCIFVFFSSYIVTWVKGNRELGSFIVIEKICCDCIVTYLLASYYRIFGAFMCFVKNYLRLVYRR